MHPFVKLMRTYCIDYTNAHNQNLYDEIMEPDYVLHMMGFTVVRDESYAPAVTRLYEEYPGLGLQVHEFVLNGDRLCMRFSEHGASLDHDGQMAVWRGIGLYKWNGRRLTENYVEQDYVGRNRQLATGTPDPLEPPHLDPWLATAAVPAEPPAEASARAWLMKGDVNAAGAVVVDDSDVTGSVPRMLDVDDITINDLFSAGPRVAFHVTQQGPYAGGLETVPAEAIGRPVQFHIAGLLSVAADGSIADVRAVTSRLGIALQLTGQLA